MYAAIDFRRFLAVFLALLGILSCLQAQYSGGSGTADDPYQIATAAELIALSETPEDYDKHFVLTADIDLDPNRPGGKVFDRAVIAPDTNGAKAGFQGTPFTGVFDGNGHTISHLTYASTHADYVGLFGSVGTWEHVGVIKDLGLISPNVNAGAGDYVGSLAGEVKKGRISGCYAEGGNVAGDENVGGLVGAGGANKWDVFPWLRPSTLSNAIYNCCSTSSVYGTSAVGGLVGSNYEGTIVNCYATGAVGAREQVGGLVGRNGNWLVEYSWRVPGTIWNCYSTGLVSGESHVGGLVGLHREGSVIGCFWDMETSGQTTSDGGTGQTTAEMQTARTFLDAGWDFVAETANGTEDIWWILEGKDYPRLWWELPSDGFQVLVVDDFESYDDEDNRIWNTWMDGWFNGTGSQIGWEIWIETIVHSGCEAMPFQYSNFGPPYYSEVGRTWSPVQDWTVNGMDSLVLYVRGTSTNGPAVLYVALEDSVGEVAIVPYADDTASTATNWLEWEIPLSSFAGVNLARVKTMYIGVGDRGNPVPGGQGIIYVDDISLAQRMP
jgi:hypothetical protein